MSIDFGEQVLSWLTCKGFNIDNVHDHVITVYHVSKDIVIEPEITKAKVRGERGYGFYVFTWLKPAVFCKYCIDGIINVYEFDLDLLARVIRYDYIQNGHYETILRYAMRLTEADRAAGYYADYVADYWCTKLYTNAITFCTGKSDFTKRARGQIAFHHQDVIEHCLTYSYIIEQSELRDSLTDIALSKEEEDRDYWDNYLVSIYKAKESQSGGN